jgi:hypothetical protein
MKQSIIRLTIILFTVSLLAACGKEPVFNNDDKKVGISRVVYFPSVAIKGERLIIINQGTAFTDPGVDAQLNGQAVNTTTTGSVNVNTPGVYNLTYSASSPDGYSASDWRTVVVMSNSAQVTNNNFSGTYQRPGFATATWTKTGRGIYTVDNPGGAPTTGVGFIVTLVNYDANKIAIPKQQAYDPSSDGLNTISSNSEVYRAGDTPVTVDYALTAGGYGTQVRNFIKQ